MNDENITAIIRANAEQHGSRLALSLKGCDPAEEYTYQELFEHSAALADYFLELDIKVEDRIGLLCESRPRWGVLFFAITRAGAIVLPLDCRLSTDELHSIVADAEPRILLVSGPMEKIGLKLAASLPVIEHLISVEAPGTGSSLPSMDTLRARKTHPPVERTSDDVAVLTYTSGTTGTVKGVLTSYGSLLFQIKSYYTVMRIDSDNACVSILPLNHLFELVSGFLGVLYGGGSVCYCTSLMPQEILEAMRERQVTCMMTVPLFLKLLADGINKELDKQPAARRLSFAVMMKLAGFIPLALRRWIFRDVHRRFGGRLEYFVSGGAALEVSIYDFFWRLGLPVYQGYGMAEASPVISTNGLTGNRAGSVGKPLPGVEVKISDVGESGNGEILTRGPHLMHGYFRNPVLTGQVIDRDGWLHTGDLGYRDRHGYLFISGRKKNLIVLGSGKNVHPEELEENIFGHPDILEGCILGIEARSGILAGSEEVCAIVVPTEEATERARVADENLSRVMRTAIAAHSLNIAAYKQPTRIVVSTEPLPKTTTHKIRRCAVRDRILSQDVEQP